MSPENLILSLCRQGLPIDSNYIQLLELRGEDDNRISKWLQRKTNKYTSGEAQNGLLKWIA